MEHFPHQYFYVHLLLYIRAFFFTMKVSTTGELAPTLSPAACHSRYSTSIKAAAADALLLLLLLQLLWRRD